MFFCLHIHISALENLIDDQHIYIAGAVGETCQRVLVTQCYVNFFFILWKMKRLINCPDLITILNISRVAELNKRLCPILIVIDLPSN